MKLLNAILISAVSALICYSCGNNTDKKSNNSKIAKEEITDTSNNVTSDLKTEDMDNVEMITKTTYKIYDNFYVLNGRVKKMLVIRYPANLVNGLVVADTSYYQTYHELRFNEDGKETLNTYYIASGGGYASFSEKDSSGNPTKIEYYNFSDDNAFMIGFRKYDQKSRLVKDAKYFNSPFELATYNVITYDDSNNSMITKDFEANHKIKFKSHEYLDSFENVISKTGYTYNDDTISFISKQTFGYVYDKYNNWTIQYENGGDGEYGVTYRIFTYYE
jgi:hypothetical protein